ncbi:hypothetical protein AN684_0200055 [Klebsiella pneumoniae subsp. pneumoniae]|nr:hypothetical protein APU09_21450 [Klebsiella pneumoniae]OCN32752.1 hypothetical protein AN657_0200055 [Klebsiella pneumoniae subsp. pneumoniae]OCN45538.1 hypothetical protein AN656_0200220 [Klebsiella pneumoniae subsp. pneumoniae]OCN67795.1 hypothetical protein AN675_0225685 [Klebsiella pneumoniae subsp. pneumoniae]OCN80139.1 hypothetical protein AN678_0228285 [Klebsiella pneumoniae subsp. pneumoniae]
MYIQFNHSGQCIHLFDFSENLDIFWILSAFLRRNNLIASALYYPEKSFQRGYMFIFSNLANIGNNTIFNG